MIRDETIDTGKPIRPADGNADVSGVRRGRVIRYAPLTPDPLWNECVRCHRRDTMVETPASGKDGKVWNCRKCGETNTPGEMDAYFGDVMFNDMNTSECPPVMTTAMSRCAEILFRHSKGEHVSRAEAGNAARLLIRRVERYAAEPEAWYDDAEK